MKNALPIVLLLVLVLAFFSDVIFGGRVLLTTNPARYEPWSHYAGAEEGAGRSSRTDALFTYLPRQAELSGRIRAGDFPLWNPNVFCGAPFFADPQSRVLYPFTLALTSVDPVRAFGYDIALHFFLAMLGMYLFLRAAGASAAGSLAGAVSFGFSSFMFTRMGHPTFVAAASYIPWLFLAYERARRGVRGGPIMLVVSLALGYLAGFPQVFLFGVISLAGYAIYMAAEGTLAGERGQFAGLIKSSAIPAGLALLVVSVQLIPFREFIDNSAGLGYDFETMKRVHMWNPVLLLRSVFPNLFGNPSDGTNYIVLIQHEVHHQNTGFLVYSGAGAFLLAWGSLAYARVSRQVRFMLFLLIASVGLGTSSVLLRAAYAVVPYIGFSQIDRISVISCFALSTLCGLTLSAAARARDPGRNRALARIVVAVLVLVGAASIVFFAMRGDISRAFAERLGSVPASLFERGGHARLGEWAGGSGDAWFGFASRQVLLGLAFLASAAAALLAAAKWGAGRGRIAAFVFLALLVCDVIVVARTFYVTQKAGIFGWTPGIEFLDQGLGEPGKWRFANYQSAGGALPSNTGQVFGLHSVRGRATAVPETYADFMTWALAVPGGRRVPLRPAGRLHGASLDAACARYIVTGHGSGEGPGPGYVQVYDGDMLIYENPDALAKGFCAARSEVGRVTRGGETVLASAGALENATRALAGTADIVSYEADRVELDVSADRECYLIVQDLFYPGWRATVDGGPGSLLRTDTGFRAVPLEAGRHRIVMEFRPKSFNIGLLLTFIGIILSVLYATKAKARRRA